MRLIREEEAPRPSARLSNSGNLPKIAAARKMEPERLTKLVRGELDWIVMRCLEKNRTRRYETASSLAQDVEHYLRDEPVEACPPSVGYRLRKFARKNQVVLSTASMIILLLVAGVAVSAWQAIRALQAENLTSLERDRAVAAERKAQQEEQKALKSVAEANAMISFFKELTLESQRAVKGDDGDWRDMRMDEAVAIIDSEKIRALFVAHPLAEAEIREWLAAQAWPTEARWRDPLELLTR